MTLRGGCVLNVVRRGRYQVTLACGMCSHQWTASPAMLSARLKRWGLMKCPRCGATLTKDGR